MSIVLRARAQAPNGKFERNRRRRGSKGPDRWRRWWWWRWGVFGMDEGRRKRETKKKKTLNFRRYNITNRRDRGYGRIRYANHRAEKKNKINIGR